MEGTEEKLGFLNLLESLYAAQKKDGPLARFREKGWALFQKLGLPSRKGEVFQYIKLNKLYKKPLRRDASQQKMDVLRHILPECKNSYIVFLNGELDLSLSDISALPEKIIAVSLKDAFGAFGSFINNQSAKNLQEELDPFSALNAAFIEKALFLYLPPKSILEAPLQLIYIVNGENQLLSPRIECFFGALSEAKIVATVLDEGTDNLTNGVANFFLEEGAQVEFSRLVWNENKAGGWHFDAIRANLKKDSRLTTISMDNGAENYRADYKVALSGPGADVHLNGVSMLAKNFESHTHVLVDHQAPECTSLQIFKNVLDGVSRSSFEGKIFVHKIAQKTQAFQLNNNLILHDGAESNSKPNLEIYADDVKASHGSTVGSLDKEQLFYLKTRGISESLGKNLLIQGFCLEIIDKIKVPSLLFLCQEKAKNYL